MSDAFKLFTSRTRGSKENFATALGKLFMGPQGPAAAELLHHMLDDSRSRFCVDFNNLLVIHLGRMHRDDVLRQLMSPTRETNE